MKLKDLLYSYVLLIEGTTPHSGCPRIVVNQADGEPRERVRAPGKWLYWHGGGESRGKRPGGCTGVFACPWAMVREGQEKELVTGTHLITLVHLIWAECSQLAGGDIDTSGKFEV